jgi:hydrogenase-4 membrane subunit HyfE
MQEVRFFYGNVRYIDCAFATSLPQQAGQSTTDKGSNVGPVRLGVDLFVIIFESLLVAASSFYISRPLDYLILLFALLVLELIWFLFTRIVTVDETANPDPARQRRQYESEAAIILSAAAVGGTIFALQDAQTNVVAGVGTAVLAASFVIDLMINGKFYFE